jgi:hypothetical protein
MKKKLIVFKESLNFVFGFEKIIKFMFLSVTLLCKSQVKKNKSSLINNIYNSKLKSRKKMRFYPSRIIFIIWLH